MYFFEYHMPEKGQCCNLNWGLAWLSAVAMSINIQTNIKISYNKALISFRLF